MENPLTPHILVVEDQPDLAAMLEQHLCERSYRVCVASSVAQALDLIQEKTFQAAMLDINLGTALVFPVAAALQHRDIPFFFASSYSKEDLPGQFSNCTLLPKPYEFDEMTRVLRALLDCET